MDDRADRGTCPRCGSRLPPDAPAALCPVCQMAAAGSGEASTRLAPARDTSAESPVRPRLIPGGKLGRYVIHRLLGRGGMGEVYEAEDLDDGRRVALKLLAGRMTDAADRARFLYEGQLAASINHPNSVFVFGSDEVDGMPIIVMELAHGGTLKDRVQTAGALAPSEAVDAILQVIAGLDAAQAAGILHRDIKPSNCFVDRDGTVKVGDFGLSISTLSRDVSRLSLSGTFQGTPQFAAPEQLRGEPLDVRADIYAVGATLYYLLTGRVPFDEADLTALVSRVLTEAPKSPRALNPKAPGDLAAIVLRCLAKDKALRPASYAALTDALRAFSSAAAPPAPLGLRFAAGAIDSVVVYFLTFAIAVPTAVVVSGNSVMVLAVLAAMTAVKILYFGLLEGLAGAAAGKALLDLGVVGPSGGVAGLARASLRALLFEAPDLIGLGIILVTARTAIPAIQLEIQSASSLVSLALFALLFSSARRRNGFAAWHDLATRTRVVKRVRRAGAPGTAVSRAMPEPVEAFGTLAVGPYVVAGEIGTTDAGRLLAGFDPLLRRRVWIHAVAPGTPPVPPATRDQASPISLRWLTGRRAADDSWDAYEALDGASFLTVATRPQPWSVVKRWLLDTARAPDTGTSPQEQWSLERLWITRRGDVRRLPFRAPDVHRDGSEQETWYPSRSTFLHAVATVALGDGPGFRPMPASARGWIDRLSGGERKSTEDLLATLTDLVRSPDRISRKQRVLHLAILGAFPVASALVSLWFRNVTAEDPFSRIGPLPVVTLTVWALLALISAVAAGRSTLLHLLGIAVVARTGRPASRLRLVARTAIAWFPIIWLTVFWVFNVFGIQVPAGGPGRWMAAAMFVVGVGWSVVRPQRGLQDLLAGTWLVPR